MILAIKTDTETAQLWLYGDNRTEIATHSWEAGRTLSDTLLHTIIMMLSQSDCDIQQLGGVIVFRGPGSFTGLRIGCAVANAISYALGVPIIGEKGESWRIEGFTRLAEGQNDSQVLPHYGAEPNITRPKR